jgi:hypothetical protein
MAAIEMPAPALEPGRAAPRAVEALARHCASPVEALTWNRASALDSAGPGCATAPDFATWAGSGATTLECTWTGATSAAFDSSAAAPRSDGRTATPSKFAAGS